MVPRRASRPCGEPGPGTGRGSTGQDGRPRWRCGRTHQAIRSSFCGELLDRRTEPLHPVLRFMVWSAYAREHGWDPRPESGRRGWGRMPGDVPPRALADPTWALHAEDSGLIGEGGVEVLGSLRDVPDVGIREYAKLAQADPATFEPLLATPSPDSAVRSPSPAITRRPSPLRSKPLTCTGGSPPTIPSQVPRARWPAAWPHSSVRYWRRVRRKGHCLYWPRWCRSGGV